MSKQMTFFIYLIERYAAWKGLNAQQVLQQWDNAGVTDFIYDMYEMYHIERLENVFADIEALLAEKQGNDR